MVDVHHYRAMAAHMRRHNEVRALVPNEVIRELDHALRRQPPPETMSWMMLDDLDRLLDAYEARARRVRVKAVGLAVVP